MSPPMTDTDMIEAMAREGTPDFLQELQGYASMCERSLSIDDGPILAAKFRDAAFCISIAKSELDRLRNLVAILQQQAEIHAQEARTANATIYEAYQAVTGATGEPGNWNGARPIRGELDRLRAENARMRSAGTDALTVLKFAFNRIHVLPRSRDTELANDIDKVLGRLRAALSAPALDGEGR